LPSGLSRKATGSRSLNHPAYRRHGLGDWLRSKPQRSTWVFARFGRSEMVELEKEQ
jgi:hypothetical protein